ncbi:hypothetical protein EMCRGX_G022722 [Ephydatia muelleri]
MERTLQEGFSEAAVNDKSNPKVVPEDTISEVNTICKTESSVAVDQQPTTHDSPGDDALDKEPTLQAPLDTDNHEKLYSRFLHANDLLRIIESFADLKTRLQLTNLRGFALYREMKSKLRNMWKAVELFDMLDRRAKQREFKQQTAALDRRVLVVGAGPIGLRTAIDCAFLGCDTVVVEKRRAFTRNNVLHLWPFTIKDLRELGAKKFFGKFCAGAIDHVSIRTLQCILLKVCLLLGVVVYPGVEFDKILEPDGTMGWHATFHPPDHAVNQFDFEVIVGTDGRRSSLPGFEKRELRGRLALAITANFTNYCTREEAACSEISGVAFIFNQQFFKDLKQDTGIDLENIVYYRDDTHYFVMTAKKESLLSKGVLLTEFSDTKQLLGASNINHEKLCLYAKEAATWSTHLPKLDFAFNHRNQEDVALFDFTSIHAANCAARAHRRNGKDLIMCLAGDSLLEPFWPKGTGCGQGFLSAMDTAWMIQRLGEGRHIIELLCERESVYQLLAQTTPEKLQQSLDKYTIDPMTRYTNLNLQQVKPNDVIQLYDTGNEPMPKYEPRPHRALVKTQSSPSASITTAQEEDVRLERSKTFTQTVAPKLRIPSQVAERREIFAKARPFSLLNLPTTDGTASRENNRASVSVVRWGSESSEHCYFCGKRVYLMERVSANGLNLHRNCFRCAHCRTQLEVGGYCLSKAEGTEKAKLFCTAHYMQIFLSNPRALNYSRSGIAERFGSSITIEEEPKTEETVTAVQAVQPDIEESSPAQPAEVTAPSQPAIEITEPDDQVFSEEPRSTRRSGWFYRLCCCCCLRQRH